MTLLHYKIYRLAKNDFGGRLQLADYRLVEVSLFSLHRFRQEMVARVVASDRANARIPMKIARLVGRIHNDAHNTVGERFMNRCYRQTDAVLGSLHSLMMNLRNWT
jgi:hypothetical protein